MGNVLIYSTNKDIAKKYSDILSGKFLNVSVCLDVNNVFSEINKSNIDIFLIDINFCEDNLYNTIQNIKSYQDNAQIILLSDNSEIDSKLLSCSNGFILSSFSEENVITLITSYLKTKSKIDKLTVKNTDMAESLYRLNVLYNTSSQFAGTLDVKELLDYMIEGLDRSLSFDIVCNISFGFCDEPVLIINSLYDLSEELVDALKLRAILNYKSLFNDKEIPHKIDDKNLKIIKNIKNLHEKFNFSIFQYDNLFAPIDLGEEFFGCIEVFRKKMFSSDDAAYFQTIVRQVSLPLKSAGLYNEIKEKNNELEKLQRIKSEFISIVSHELRTPLTPIKNALSILSSGRCGILSENAGKFVDMAKRNVTNLAGIINDILDINKIEAGKMVFKFEKTNIFSVIENIKNNYDYVAKENNINFIVNNNENLPQIYADTQRLEQVLRNLVSNAIKFTPQGKSIVLNSEIKNAEDIKVNKYFTDEIKNLSGDYIVVSVADEGIGIKEENLIKAFEQFSQIENALTRKVGGTGLGLPIAKQLIKAHKGAIWCDSEENKGSVFSFAIPVCSQNSELETLQEAMV